MSRRPPYWLLLAFVAALFAPVPWLAPALVAAGLTALLLRGLRGLATRQAAALAEREARVHDGVLLGSDHRGRDVRLSERELSAHGLVLGASGAGKTTTLLRIATDLVSRGRPIVIIDMKGSPAFAHSIATAAASAGRPFRLWTPDGPTHWNPLQHGNATELKDKLIATERFTEPHYQRAAERYVQNVIQVLHAKGTRAATLSEVVDLLDPHRFRGALRTIPHALRDRLQDYLAGLAPDQLSAARGLQTRLAVLTESHTGRYLEPGRPAQTMDLHRALSGQDVILFSLNTSTYGKLAAQLGTLAVQDLVCAAGHRLAQVNREQGFIVIDEASLLGGDHILSLFARARESNLGVLAATQELADLERAAHGLRDQVLGNTAVKLVHRQEVPSSAQTIAQLAGTEKAWEETQRTGGPFLSGLWTGAGTRRMTEQFVVHPNEIKTLGVGDAVLISKLRAEKASTIRVRPPEHPHDQRPERGPRGGATRSRPDPGPDAGR